MRGIILTAGEGTRMRPLTLTRPKTMLPVGGKPLLQYNVEALRDAGIVDIILVVGYYQEVVKEHFQDGSKLGVQIDYVTQEKRLGTAHAIGTAGSNGEDEVIILNGDILVQSQVIKSLIDKYQRTGCDTILTLTEVEDPSSFGVVELQNDRIMDIIEKPAVDKAPSNLINAGIYLFTPEIFETIKITPKSPRGEYEITDSIKIQIQRDKTVLGLTFQDRWIDIGRPWELLEVNEHFLDNLESKIEGEIEEGATVHGPLVLGKGSIVRSGSYIMGPVVIGEDADIGPNSFIRKYTSIGDRVSVGNGVEIKNSIIMEDTNVNHLTYVGDSVIGASCNLAAGTNIANLRFDDGEVKLTIKTERINTGRRKLGVIFADDVKTGINSSFNPGVMVGEGARVGSGAIIYRDVPSHMLVIPIQEHDIVDRRLEN
ncbi:MAG TPA: bifunctional sugar-1-phosphate nucleotidylyltransferase/acetyltransferase [Methanobacteriaceae archaeon]|nr:bifunctional sugar-1-phosphate nucleotidylyltransferase/acetyltransferase [Methanobacteriaceae archaeon]